MLIYTHGGGFSVGSRQATGSWLGIWPRKAAFLRWSWIIVAPRESIPGAIGGCCLCLQGVIDSGIKAKNIEIIGDSAGGNLAVASVLKFRELGLELPGFVIAFSPWVDLEITGADSMKSNAETEAPLGRPRQSLEGMRGMYIGDDESSKARVPY